MNEGPLSGVKVVELGIWVAAPVDFGDTPALPRGPSPELGQHTEEVLLELGYTWDEIGGLKESGTIG